MNYYSSKHIPRSPAEMEKQAREIAAMSDAAAKFLARGGEVKTKNDRKPRMRDGKPIPVSREKKPPRWEDKWSAAIQSRATAHEDRPRNPGQ
jgi:hypothetical protein